MTFTITPLVMAYGPQREKSRFTFLHNFGEKIDDFEGVQHTAKPRRR